MRVPEDSGVQWIWGGGVWGARMGEFKGLAWSPGGFGRCATFYVD